MLAAGVTWII